MKGLELTRRPIILVRCQKMENRPYKIETNTSLFKYFHNRKILATHAIINENRGDDVYDT